MIKPPSSPPPPPNNTTEIISDPAYPGQWRVKGEYIEQVAKVRSVVVIFSPSMKTFGGEMRPAGPGNV
jgi:hypothetical protein